MVILHLLNMREYSGAENVAINIINSYSANIKGIYLSPLGKIKEIVEENGICYYGVDKLSYRSVRNAIKDIKPDIIHAHDYTATVIASIVARNIPIISHIHNNLPWMRKMSPKSALVMLSMNRVNYCIGVSASVFNEAWFDFDLCCKYEVIGNPVDIKIIQSKKKMDIESDVVFVGRLSEQKNPFEFLRIIKQLIDDGIDVRAKIVGDGPLHEQCELYIKENRMENNLCLCGFVNNPYDYMSNKSVLVIPSLWEGFGLVAIEALSLGVPVVATAVGGLQALVDDSCGCCSNFFDTRYSAIKSMITDRDLYRKKSIGAIQKAKKLDNSGKYIQRIEEIYKMLI